MSVTPTRCLRVVGGLAAGNSSFGADVCAARTEHESERARAARSGFMGCTGNRKRANVSQKSLTDKSSRKVGPVCDWPKITDKWMYGVRSEERRVGKEGRPRGVREHIERITK